MRLGITSKDALIAVAVSVIYSRYAEGFHCWYGLHSENFDFFMENLGMNESPLMSRRCKPTLLENL